mgnify:CR=1 FL=1|jgi:hypothetical protein
MISLSLQTPDANVNINATSSMTVTTTNPALGDNFFNSTSISTNYSLPDCTQSNSFGIGVIIPNDASDLEAATVERIVNQVDAAYNTYHSDVVIGPGTNLVTFADYDELNSYVRDKQYADNQLCFAFGFSTFDPTNAEFEFDLYFPVTAIGDTRQN